MSIMTFTTLAHSYLQSPISTYIISANETLKATISFCGRWIFRKFETLRFATHFYMRWVALFYFGGFLYGNFA